MGEIARTMGFGGPKQTAQPLPPMQGDPTFSLLGGYGLPSVDESGATPSMPHMQPQAPAQPAVGPSMEIEGWKPHHRTTLGFLADAVLMGLGSRVAPFAKKVNDQNMQEAMEGFTQDPEHTIQRIAKINPKMALELQERYTDNTRMNGNLERQNAVFDMKKEDVVFNRVAGMMGAANEKTWPKMRQVATAIGNKYGVDVSSYIPETYDPESVEFIRNGAVKPIDKMKLDETTDYHDKTIKTRERGQDLTDARGQTRLKETGRHNQVMETRPAKASPVKPTGKNVMTKYGPGVVSPDGSKMKVYRNNTEFRYVNVNGTWVPYSHDAIDPKKDK
jgi:hypothetical protein